MALTFGKRLVICGVLLLSLSVAVESDQDYEPLLRPSVSYSAPFRPNERLRYEVYWKPVFLLPAFKAGELDFKLEETTYREKPAYRVKVEAISTGRLASIARMDVRDYFESTFDRNSFRPYRLIKKTREGKRQRDFEMIFDYPQDRMLARESDVAQTPPKELRNQVIEGIKHPLVDIVSVFYVGRLHPLKTGDRLFTHLVDEGEARRVEVIVGKTETVGTGLGHFRTLKVNTNGRIFGSGGNLRVWYAADSLRVPVKFEADVTFGKVYGTIIQMEAEGVSRGLVRSR